MTTPVQRLLSGQQQGFQTSAGFLAFCQKWLLGVFASFQKVAALCVCKFSKSGCFVCLQAFKMVVARCVYEFYLIASWRWQRPSRFDQP